MLNYLNIPVFSFTLCSYKLDCILSKISSQQVTNPEEVICNESETLA